MDTYLFIGGPFDGKTRTVEGTPTLLHIQRRNGMFSTYIMRKMFYLILNEDDNGRFVERHMYHLFFHSRLRRRERNRCRSDYIVAALKAHIAPSSIAISRDLPECFQK